MKKSFTRLLRLILTIAMAVTGAVIAADDIANRPEVHQALQYLAQHETAQVDLQVKIAEIPAPPFHEEQRAAAIAAEFRRVHLDSVEIDGAGNVLALRKGASPRVLVVAAHLDTVFPAGTDVKVKRQCSASTTFPVQRQLFLPIDDNYKLFQNQFLVYPGAGRSRG